LLRYRRWRAFLVEPARTLDRDLRKMVQGAHAVI
jgi:hypothetical protein